MPPRSSSLELLTSWGVVRVSISDGRVTGCRLPGEPRGTPPPFALRSVRRSVCAGDASAARAVERYLRALFAGRPAAVPGQAPPACGPFVAKARRAMAAVPRGRVITYTQLAAKAGRPRAARAAGQACATNPLPLFIPCHRIVGADGRLGGFTGGLAWKRLLLALEDAPEHWE